jgi:tetratricopeptide (TPR) repeat protein
MTPSPRLLPLFLWLPGLLGGCPPPAFHGAIDPKLVVDSARDKDLPQRAEALRELADKIVQSKPTSAAPYDRALAALELALAGHADDYELLWRAARACFLVTEYVQDKEQNFAYAEGGRKYGERAVAEQPKRVEGYYYLALDTAKVAESKNKLRLLKPAMAAAETAAKIDPSFDEAGPLRFMGKVYLTAPAWPVSIGAPEKALEVLEKAVTLSPAPLNRLFLGQAYFHEEEYDKARTTLEQALRDGREVLGQRWRQEGEDYLRRLKTKPSP